MRHMRSRRILAMLLALSMIFGLLTTTAFAGEVDQNTSNVGESAANGTSEGGSGEGQSSGASEDESSKETNKEDVPTEEETIPEEKKTTSSEEGDTQEGEEPTPVETQLTNYVMVGGIAGFEDTKFASFEAAYEAIKPTVATLGLIQESPANAAAFDAVFTDVQDGIATLTYTIAGNITYDETNLDHLLTMGRQSSHYLTNERHLINFKFVGANGDRADTLTINSDITLPYEWWGENTTTSISFEDLTITGSAPNGLYPYQKFFEGIDFTVDNCTLKGIKIYNCANVGGSYTITNSTLNGMGAAANAYAIHLQGHETAPLNITIRDNKISGYDRGINIDQKTAVATISNNEISVKDSGRSCIQLSGLAETTISGNTLALNGGNAFTLHEKLLTLSAAPEISITGNTISGNGYLIYDDAAANGTAFTADTLNLTYSVNTVDSTVNTTQGVKGNTVVASSEAVKTAVEGTTSNAVATVGGVSYDTLDEALKYVTAGTPLTWVDESVWAVDTPVYYAGHFYSNIDELLYYAQQNKGIITPDSTDEAVIYCRPNANITNGNFSHASYVTNTTIYGNGATLSGATEWDVENYYTLTKDITINIYNLNGGASVWGTRESNYTVTVNMIGCEDAHEVLFNYGSGNGQVIVTVKDCTFLKSGGAAHGWPVSINCLGSLTVDGCTFDGVTTGVVVNVKQPSENGKMTVSVKDSMFNNVTGQDQNKGALRVTGLQACDIDLTIDNVKFTGTHADPEDITIGNVKSGENLGKVSYNISNTEGSLTAHKVGETTSEKLTLDSTKPYTGTNSGSTGVKGSSPENAYTLEELGKMTRNDYIAAQKELDGTMYVTVGNYSYDKDGVLGNGVRNDTPGQAPNHDQLNSYAENGYLGEKNDGANGLNIVFVNGSITSGVTGYKDIDNIGTSLLLAVPAYTNVTFKGITFNNVMCFNYQLYTGPWSQLGELKFDGCTFKGIIVGAIAAQTLTFNGCTFTNFTNTTDANSSNPTWIRPAYGNWKESDNEGQGENFKSLTTINFTNNNVTSTRPVKFEFISQWNKTTTLTATGNSFDISAQDSDTETKNVGLYIGPHTDKNAVDLVLDKNTKSERTAALYVIPAGKSQLPVGSTVKDSSGTEIEITDALEWKTDTKVTLKTETVPAVKNVAKVGETEYATLEDAIAKAEAGQTVTLIADVNTPETTYVVSKDLTIDLNGKTVTGYGYDGVFQINGANANVLIKNGNVVAVEKTGSEGKYAMAVWACAENCEVTLEDLTVTQDITHTDDKQMDMIYTSKGTIIINSGSFTSGTPAWTLNCKDAAFKDGSAKIIVNGGTFTGFDPCNNAAEGKGTSFVAEGVGVDYDENGSFTAKAGMVAQILDASGNSVKAYTSLADAIAAAAAGQTVRLLADATEDVTITKNITLDLGGKMLTNTGAGKATITIANGATATVKNGSVVGGTSYYNIQNNGTATFEGLTATAGNDGSSMIDNYGTLTITSGEYTGGLDTIKNEPNAKLTVDGGTFTLTKGASKGFTGVIFNYGELTINDGTFIQSDKSAPYGQAQVIHTDKSGSNAPSTVIKGGTFKNLCTRSTAWTVRATNAAAGATKVSGGTFNKSISEDYCADGFIPTKNADGTYGVKKGKYVATVDDTGYETLAAAVKTKINGKTVMLLDDVTENIEITKAKNFTLDLNGHTINGGTVKDKATITNYGTVTIIDSSAAKTGTIKRDDNGTVGETSYYVIHNIGTMTIEQANVTNNSGYKKTNPSGSMVGSSLICNGDDDLGGTLNISGGKFEQKNFIAIKNGALGKLNVTGGTISSDHSAIQNWFEATITGGEINGQLWTDAYIADESVGHTTIGGSAKYTGEIVMDISGSVKPTLEISGGTLDVTNWRITTAASKAGAKPAVSGGTFSSAIPYEYCAAGYIPADKGDGKYGVKEGTYVAEVNGKQYETLQAAIDAASRKQTVKLIADTTENVTMGTPYLTLDLNGHTLNGGQVKGKPALTVTARVTVMDSSAEQTGTIKRDDTAENSGVSSHYVIDVQGDGWLTFESGNVTNDSGVVGVKGASLVRVGDDSVEKYPGLNIKGGNFKQDNFIAIKVDRGDLFLNGGTITSKNSYAIENWHRATIKGGTVKGSVASWTYSGGSNSTTTIIGGTINGNVNSVNYGNAEGKTAKVTISGGTVNGELDTRSYDPTTNELTSIDDAAKATIGVTGGTFSKDPTKYVVEGSSVTTNSDGTFGVEKAYLCKVGETKYYTMEDAFKAQTTSGEPIVLLRDYTTGSSFPSGSINRTVDLDGHTWTYTGSDVNSAAFEVNHPNVMLTVKNGTVVSNSMVGLIPTAIGGTIKYPNSGLVFEKVEATANGHSGIETNGGNESVSVTLKNSTLNVPNGFGIYFPSSGTLTIDNSKITAMTMGVQVCSGSLDISGADTKIEVTGDGVEKTENDGAIQDGAAISIVNRAGYKGLGTITVTEGTFKANGKNAAVKAYDWSNKEPGEANFTASDKVAISGGSYSTPVAENLCAEGFVPVTNGDGTYGVQPDGNVAEIGSMKYKSLDEALKAAKDRETVKLLKDAELEEVVIRSGRTLDLNGHTLKADYVTYFGGNLVDNSAAHTGLLKVLSADEILFTKNKKIDAMTQIPIYSLEKQGYVFEEIVLRVAPVTNKTPGALQAVYRPRQKDGTSDLSDAQKAMFGSANGHPVTATFRLVYKYKNSNEVQTFEFDFVDTYMDIYLNQNLYMYVTVTGLDIANIETITVTPVLKSAGGQVELVGKTIDTPAVLANLIGQ